MRQGLCGLALCLFLACHSGAAQAISLDFVPASQAVMAGTPVEVALRIDGLGDNASPALSTFDLNVHFNPLILAFTGAVFGDPVLGDQLDVFSLGGNPTAASLTGPGVLNLFELSFDDAADLDSFQAGTFTLATLTFDVLATGTSALTLSINALGDAAGDPLEVVVIPEPASLLLLVSGLVGLAGLRKKISSAGVSGCVASSPYL